MGQPDRERSKLNKPYLALAGLLLLYLAVALAHAYLAPLTTGPDELAHYEYANFIAGHGRLPLDTEERSQASYKSDQPPLYHLIAALPMGLVEPAGPPFLKRVGDHPRRQLIERTRHAWGLYNTEDEQWPYRAEILRWHVGRWVAILLGAATVAATFFIARDLFGLSPAAPDGQDRPGWLAALGAAAIVAFIPRFALTGSMLNYETTVAFFTALFLWILLRIARKPGERSNQPTNQLPTGSKPFTIHNSPFTIFLLGFFSGLSIVTKLSALILPLEILVAFWLIGRYQRWGWSTWIKRLLIAAAGTVAGAGWWFGFILYRFNTVARDGPWVGLLRPLVAADASDATTNRLLSFLTGGQAGFTGAIENLDSGPPWEWLAIFFRTFWMVGIETVRPLAPYALVGALVWVLVSGVGLAVIWRRRPRLAGGLDTRLALSLLLLHLLAPLILPLLRYAATASLADTAQGRHVLFMAAPAFAILWIWGWSEVVRGQPSAVSGQRTADSGQQIADSLQQTAGSEQRIADSRQQAGDSGQRAADRKQQIADSRQQAADSRRRAAAHNPPHASRFTFHASRFSLLLPGLFLLAWSGVQLWTMTWAYHPPLPVRAAPAAKSQAVHRLDRPLNEFVTLVGYDSGVENGGRVLRLELIWEATAVSPVDYLTEVRLLDRAGQVQAEWLGYPAGGRYPTRAWDAGDIIRDTVWLPLAGLAPGPYRVDLNLLAANLQPPPAAVPLTLEAPLTLTTLDLDDPPLRQFNHNLPFTGLALAAAGYSVWQDGTALNQAGLFRYRETMVVTLSPLLPGQQRTVRLVGPPPYPPPGQPASEERQLFAPARELPDQALFIVGPDWPTGDYHLQVTVEEAGGGNSQQVNSGVVLHLIDRWERLYVRPPISRPLEANFANQVKLLGYDLAANRVEPGGGVPVTLTWQGLDWMGQDYTIFTKLLAADQSVHGGRDRLPREGYRTLYWAPGEIVIDPFGVPVDADAPPGIYYLNVGLYRQVGEQALSLPLAADGRPLDATSVNIGPILVGPTPAGFTLAEADPQVSLGQSFGDAPNLTLLGYDLAQEDGSLDLTLYWRSEAPLAVDYTTFVHLRNEAGETVAQRDRPPLAGAYPTSLWAPGEIIADEIRLEIPAGLPPGEYRIVTGLYDFQTGRRLAAPGNPDQSVLLQQWEKKR